MKAVLNQKSDLLDKNNDLAMKVQGYERSNKTMTQTEEFYEQDKQKEIKKVQDELDELKDKVLID